MEKKHGPANATEPIYAYFDRHVDCKELFVWVGLVKGWWKKSC
jgi:hypothetical protein